MSDTARPPGNLTGTLTGALSATGAAAGTGGPAPRGEQEIAALVELHTRLIDTLEGYDALTERAEPDFRSIAEEFQTLHRKHEAGVARLLASLGHDPGGDGSVFGTVNRAVVALRSWFDDIGHNVLDALVQGEKHVLEGFDEAIAASPSIERRGVLEAMRGELTALLARYIDRPG